MRKRRPWEKRYPLFVYNPEIQRHLFMPRDICFIRFRTPNGTISVVGRNPCLEQNKDWFLLLDRLHDIQSDFTYAQRIRLQDIVDAYTWFDGATVALLNKEFEENGRATEPDRN